MHPLLKRSLLFVGAIIVVVALLTWGIGLDTIKARQVDLIYLGQQHLILVFSSMFFALLIGIPSGILLSRPSARGIAEYVMQIFNVGNTLPPLAVLALAMVVIGIGDTPAIIALFLASLLPIVRNTYAGLCSVPASLLEAANGIGMTKWQRLRQVELPNAWPVMLSGIRIATAINVGTAPLAFLGRHAAGSAAIAVELALALCKKGYDIPDEAILEGLAAVENRSSIRVLSQKPLIILDACRTPQQAAALLRVLNMAKVRHMSAVIGLTEEEGAESFLAALETGLTSEEQKKDKSTMPGMGENPFDKVFLVAPAGTEAALAERLTEKARYHFDAVFCPTLAEAVEQAKANSRRGLLVCGSEAIALEALKLFS